MIQHFEAVNLPEKARTTPTLDLEWDENGVLQIGYGGDLERITSAMLNAQVTDGLFGQIAVLGSPGNRVDKLNRPRSVGDHQLR